MANYNSISVDSPGTDRRPLSRVIDNENITLRDFEAGETIFLAITGNSDISITLPVAKRGLNFTFINTLSPSGTGDAVITSAGGTDNIVTHASVGTSVAAAATISFTSKPHEGSTLQIIDADGTMAKFEVDGDADGVVAGHKALVPGDSTAAKIATKLADAINSEAGLDITATNPTTTTVLLTMDETGAHGNTTITSDFSNSTVPAAFTGGSDGGNNLLSDNVTVEAASIGGEWLEFMADDNFWYCKVTKSDNPSMTMQG
jgi:hypothetical protein